MDNCLQPKKNPWMRLLYQLAQKDRKKNIMIIVKKERRDNQHMKIFKIEIEELVC